MQGQDHNKFGPEPVPDPALSAVDSSHMVFSEPTVENEMVQLPKLFLGIVQRQWASPEAAPPPSGTERKLYNVATDLSEALRTPTVDKPVAALTYAALLPNDAVDCLKAEKKKAELALCKGHQVAAWAVKAAMSASFLIGHHCFGFTRCKQGCPRRKSDYTRRSTNWRVQLSFQLMPH